MAGASGGEIEEYGRTFQQIIDGTQPAAGSDFTFKPDGAHVSRVLAVKFHLACSNHVATRTVLVQFCDGAGTVVAYALSTSTVVASGALDYCGFLGSQDGVVAGLAAVFPLPRNVLLYPGQTLVVHVNNMDTADQLSAIELVVRQYVTGPEPLTDYEAERLASLA